MIPLRICLEGFLSYREPQTLSFEGASLWVLSGQNGAGKSAVFDAITFALFGRHRGKGKANKELIHHDADGLIVEFDFELDGERYRVRRTLARRGRSTFSACRLLHPQDGDEMLIDSIEGADSEKGLEDWVAKTVGLNYEAFVSSVLLKQGQTEALLSKEPKDRYKVLAQVIDLSAYQRLYERTKARLKKWETDATIYEQKLDVAPEVSNEQISAAQKVVAQAECEWNAVQAKADDLLALREQAATWERLMSDLNSLAKRDQEACAWLTREEEIKAGLARWQKLDRVLPTFASIVGQRQRLSECQQQIRDAEQRNESLREKSERANASCQETEASAERWENEVIGLQSQIDGVRTQLDALSPLVRELEDWEREKIELERINGELGQLPDQLPQLLEEAEEKARRLSKIEGALGWLEQLAASRTNLTEVTENGKAKRAKFDSLNTELAELEKERTRLEIEIERTVAEERKFVQEEASARNLHGITVEKRNHFNIVAAQARCDSCGQAIDDDHRRKELARLEKEIADTEKAWRNAEENQQAAAGRLSELRTSQVSLNCQSSQIKEDHARIQGELEGLRGQCKGVIDSLKRAFEKLPADYQGLVSPGPNNQIDWLKTSYPAATDLTQLQQQMQAKKSCDDQLATLRKQHTQWQQFDAQRRATQKKLATLGLAERLEEAQQARAESHCLKHQQTQIETTFNQHKAELNAAREAAKRTRNQSQEITTQLQNCVTEAASERAKQEEIVYQLQSDIVSLPESCQSQAEKMTARELEDLHAEQRQLACYQGQFDELTRAHQSLTTIEEQRKKAHVEIESLLPSARRPVSEVGREWQAAAQERDVVDLQRQAARTRLDDLEGQQRNRQRIEADFKAADRQQKLYGELTKQLGAEPGGLQLCLLQDAERAIVILANETLTGLSRGQMSLELREDAASDQVNVKSGKALDLVAYNREISEKSISIENTSGGQRLRLAVSLALAIGQYARTQTHSLESVIIDEGFSSLDRDGRDDMVQELRQLQQRLSRILIVSHEEDIARAFDNVYAIRLEDGASRVELAQ